MEPETGERLRRRRDPIHEPRSRVRKFVYLVVALLPFVAFILLLPRGGGITGEEPETEPTSTPSQITSTTGVQLAFPFDLTPVTPLDASPTPAAEDIPLEAPGRTQCSDGVDNDRDGRVDLADPGCNGTRDTSESPNPVRRTPAPPPPPPPPPAPVTPDPPPVPPTPPDPVPDPDPDPPSFPPPGPPCEPGDDGFPNCDINNDDDEPAPDEDTDEE